VINYIPTRLNGELAYIIKKEDREKVDAYERTLLEVKKILQKVKE